jgi:sugar O-acyltransferase (sialic acid O-acetyltransferase NeuD family)
MASVIVFGIRDFAELAHFYLSDDSPHEVVAFCVHREFLPEESSYLGLPIVPFEQVAEHLPPHECQFFVPMSASNMNRDRQAVYEAVKLEGYECVSYVSSKAVQFGNIIGENCFILESNTLQPFTAIGNNVTLWSGNHIGHHGKIEDHATLTSHVVVSGHCSIGRNTFVGVNATLRDGLEIAEGTFIAMGSALTEHTEPWSAYKGNPAKKLAVPSHRIRL